MCKAFVAAMAALLGALPERKLAGGRLESVLHGHAWCLAAALFAATAFRLAAQTNEAIYTDSLQNGWSNDSTAKVNFSSTNRVYSGMYSISVLCTNYNFLSLTNAALNSSQFTNLTFWINGGTNGGQPLWVAATLNGVPQTYVSLPPLATNWQQITISLTALGVANQPNLNGIWIESSTSSQLTAFYVDDIMLMAPLQTTNPPVAFTINAHLNQHPISPQIYGVAFATSNQLSDLNFTMNRSGGTGETRYNWLLNAHNYYDSYYFLSTPDSSQAPGATADNFVGNSKNGGANAMITIPMIGWSPKLAGGSICWSYSVAKYGPQTLTDPSLPDAGNGVSSTNDLNITWNDPNDANFPTNTAFQQGYVQHLLGNWGASTNGGVGYYLMDNEHSIWYEAHRDIHPVGAAMQEIWTKILATASMVKSNDPNALVLGPEEWGWLGYFYSGYDQWTGRTNGPNTDRATNGGWDYMPWLLNQFYQHNTNTGQRLLDYFTLHCYPEEAGVYGDDVSTNTELLRNQCTRILWDSNYVDPSWINSVIMLIPRMKGWVSTYYPGTKVGITEYNWGAETNINGATAQADILGIFGWQSLDLATRWETPATGTPTYNALKMYRNYDGNKSTFGDTSVSATGTDPDNVSTFAAVRSADGALTAMVVNKQLAGIQPFTMTVSNFYSSGTVQQWQLTSANVITQLANLSLTGNSVTNSLPPQSITLFVLPVGTNPPPPLLTLAGGSSTNTLNFKLNGQAGQSYITQSSSNLISWLPIATNLLTNSQLLLVLPTTNAPYRFYRAVWEP